MAVPARLVRTLTSSWTWILLLLGVLVLAAVLVRAAQDDEPPQVSSDPPSAAARPVEDSGPAPDAQGLAAQVRLVLSAELGEPDCTDPAVARDWACLLDRVEPDSTGSVRLVLAVPAAAWSEGLDVRAVGREAGRGALRVLAPQVPHLDRVVVGEDGDDWATVSRRTVVGS